MNSKSIAAAVSLACLAMTCAAQESAGPAAPPKPTRVWPLFTTNGHFVVVDRASLKHLPGDHVSGIEYAYTREKLNEDLPYHADLVVKPIEEGYVGVMEQDIVRPDDSAVFEINCRDNTASMKGRPWQPLEEKSKLKLVCTMPVLWDLSHEFAVADEGDYQAPAPGPANVWPLSITPDGSAWVYLDRRSLKHLPDGHVSGTSLSYSLVRFKGLVQMHPELVEYLGSIRQDPRSGVAGLNVAIVYVYVTLIDQGLAPDVAIQFEVNCPAKTYSGNGDPWQPIAQAAPLLGVCTKPNIWDLSHKITVEEVAQQ
jgi:hypothetical protein